MGTPARGGDWAAGEVDRRIRLMEAETGEKVPRGKRREIERRMRRGMARGLGRMAGEAARDRRDAARHGLAGELKRAGTLEEEVYLRMGGLPEVVDGRGGGAPSRAVFGYEEQGLSVFAGTLTAEGHYIVKLPNPWLRLSLVRFCEEEERTAHLVRGRRSGRGSDGEPLLSRVESVEPLPADRVVASEPSSRALEKWNDRRGA